MNKSDEQQDNDANLSQRRNRFEAMSWLYRDGLTYQPLSRPIEPESSVRIAKQPEIKKLSPPPKTTVSKKQPEQSRSNRFKSMSWLYRDSLQSAATQPTPTQKHADGTPKAKPIVSDINPAQQTKKPASRTTTSVAAEDKKYESMRWLYEDDDSFQKAIQELKAVDAAKLLKKEQAKQARKERVQKVRSTITAQTTRVVHYVRAEPKRAVIGGGVTAIILAVVVVGSIGMSMNGDANSAKVAGDNTVNQTDPEFDTLLPNNETTQADSAIAYDEQRKVANYTDTIDSTKITVSQQPLPERFTVNQAVELEKFAKEINASQEIQAGDTKAYAGVSIQGPQTLVFIKNDLLVFVKADTELPTGAWIAYIESLE